MSFREYVQNAWRGHGDNPRAVAESFEHGRSLIADPGQIGELAALVTHVMGEHLGEWSKGVESLRELERHPRHALDADTRAALARSIAVLEVGGGNTRAAAAFAPTDQARILAQAASALAVADVERAGGLFAQALALAHELATDDPGTRALAVAGNNIACTLEELPTPVPAQVELMLEAAAAAREYWERAGTWLQVERAEYRLTMSHLKAGRSLEAFKHAHNCLEIVGANAAPALEFFFGYEALALSEKAKANGPAYVLAVEQMAHYFERLGDDDKARCAPTLRRMEGTKQ